MDLYRLKHSIRMCMIGSAVKRAKYIKKHKVFKHMGDNCMVMFRKIPLYPHLISFDDNVWIASNVTFVTHDVTHRMLNIKNGSNEFKEYKGTIDIKENVFIGANSTILPDVIIGPDVIVGAGSLINRDIANGVYAGVPARYICSIEEYEKKKKDRTEKKTV